MGMFDRIRTLFPAPTGSWGAEFVAAQRRELTADPASAIGILQRMTGSSTYQPWTPPSVSQALSVPGIQRSVSLISGTTGSSRWCGLPGRCA